MPVVLALIAFGVLSRLLPHPPGGVALGAIALYAGARLPRRWAFLIPVGILTLSDVVIDTMGRGYDFDLPTRLTTYATFTLIVALGRLTAGPTAPWVRGLMAIGASTLFFLVSNFAVWASGDGFGFPMTLPGLVSTYTVALPFYGNSLVADLIGTAVLFGADGLLLWNARPKPADETA